MLIIIIYIYRKEIEFCFYLLDLFHWKRIVLDEAHEITCIKTSVYIRDLNSTFKWNITATPFANGILGFIDLMSFNTNFMENIVHRERYYQIPLIKNGFDNGLIDNVSCLFRRNTIENIKNEYSGNILNEHVHMLDFTPQERNIYDAHSTRTNHYNFLIRLCCHPELNSNTRELIKNCKTFDEIYKCLIEYNKG